MKKVKISGGVVAFIGSVVAGVGMYLFGSGIQKEAAENGYGIGYATGYLKGAADTAEIMTKDKEEVSDEKNVE